VWKTIGHRSGRARLTRSIHLDLGVEDLDRAQEYILNLGATLLDDGDGKRGWRIFADPAGHPFCLVRD